MLQLRLADPRAHDQPTEQTLHPNLGGCTLRVHHSPPNAATTTAAVGSCGRRFTMTITRTSSSLTMSRVGDYSLGPTPKIRPLSLDPVLLDDRFTLTSMTTAQACGTAGGTEAPGSPVYLRPKPLSAEDKTEVLALACELELVGPFEEMNTQRQRAKFFACFPSLMWHINLPVLVHRGSRPRGAGNGRAATTALAAVPHIPLLSGWAPERRKGHGRVSQGGDHDELSCAGQSKPRWRIEYSPQGGSLAY